MRGPAFNEKERKLVELHDLLVDVLHEELQRVQRGEKPEEGQPTLSAAKVREVREFLRSNRVDVAFTGRELDRVGPRGTLADADDEERLDAEDDGLPFSDIA